MLARLLRGLYLFQVIAGAVLGGFAAVHWAGQGRGASALLAVPIGAVVLPLALQGVVITTTMLLARALGSRGPGTPLTLWLQALWGEFQAALTVFMVRQPWANGNPGVQMPLRDTAQGVHGKPVPVLLVHGYVCNHRVWDTVALALRQAGHPVLAIDLEPLFTSIDDYAAPIDNAVAELLEKSGGTQLALIGHSMGGLAIRAWMRAHGTTRVTKVITLGTPHQGTRLAGVSATPNGAQMEWRSPWIKALEQEETQTARALMHIALTAQDNIVIPQREQVLSGATVTEFRGLGHLELCLDREPINWMLHQLAAPATAHTVPLPPTMMSS